MEKIKNRSEVHPGFVTPLWGTQCSIVVIGVELQNCKLN